jgi:hypothetical protein
MARRPQSNRLRQQTPVDIPLPSDVPQPPPVRQPPRPTIPDMPTSGEPLQPGQLLPERADSNPVIELYDEFAREYQMNIDAQRGAPTMVRGRTFYRAAPLGLEGAGFTFRVPTGQTDPLTGQPIIETFFELDPTKLPAGSYERAAERTGRAVEALGGEALGVGRQRERFLYDKDGADAYLFSLSNDQINLLKASMVATGLLTDEEAGSYNIRDLDSNPKIRNQWYRAVAVAQANGEDPYGFLLNMVRNGDMFSTTRQSQRPALTVRLTNREDIREVANSVASRRIGRALTDQEIESFATAYQRMERDYQMQAAYGGEVEAPPQAQTAATTMLQSEFGDEYETFQMGNTLDTFRQILGGQL